MGREGVSFVKESVVPVRIPIEECPETLLSLPVKVCFFDLKIIIKAKIYAEIIAVKLEHGKYLRIP